MSPMRPRKTYICQLTYVDFRDESPELFEEVKNKIVQIKSSTPIGSLERESVVEVASRDVEELRRIKEIMNGAMRRMSHANERINELRENKRSLVKNEGVKQDFGAQDCINRNHKFQSNGEDATTTAELKRTPTVQLTRSTTVEGKTGQNIFLKACGDGNTEIVKYLAEKHPDLVNSTH